MTPSDLIDRIDEAAATLRKLPDPDRRFLSTRGRSNWPTVIMSFWEAYGLEAPKMRLPPPSAQAIDRMDEVLNWMGWLTRQDSAEMKCVWLIYGERKRIVECTGILGLHRNTVRQKRDDGIARLVTHLANGQRNAA